MNTALLQDVLTDCRNLPFQTLKPSLVVTLLKPTHDTPESKPGPARRLVHTGVGIAILFALLTTSAIGIARDRLVTRQTQRMNYVALETVAAIYQWNGYHRVAPFSAPNKG